MLEYVRCGMMGKKVDERADGVYLCCLPGCGGARWIREGNNLTGIVQKGCRGREVELKLDCKYHAMH